MTPASLESAFRSAFGVFWGQGKLEAFLAFLEPDGAFIDEDTPFALDRPAFEDHVRFHLGLWESLEWIAREPRFLVAGSTGVITTAFTLRGKPKDAGFRLRHGLCSVLCHWDAGTRSWRALSIHLDPLLGHIEHASPG